MERRFFENLSRKLITREDLTFSFDGVQQALGKYTLAYWGQGVLNTKSYPNPFQITLSETSFSLSVSSGTAFDPSGNLAEIDAPTTPFNLTPADPTNPRYDLLVLQYKQVGDTLIPKPSDPLSQVYLNILDGYQLVIVEGTASGTPAYPAKNAQTDIILAGLQIEAGSTLGSQVTLDLTIRDISNAGGFFNPTSVEERPTLVSGSTYTLSKKPKSLGSLSLFIDDIFYPQTSYSLSDQTITLSEPLAVGQELWASYIAEGVSNLAGFQEVPTGYIDGANNTFILAGFPADQESTKVYVNGRKVPPTEWSLLQGMTAKIIFNVDSVPQPGQDVTVDYLVNASSVGVAPSPSSGGGSGGGSGSTPFVDQPTLTDAELASKRLLLTHTPVSSGIVQVDIIGAGAQAYGTDFTVSGNTLSWSGLGLESQLATGDRLRIFYLY